MKFKIWILFLIAFILYSCSSSQITKNDYFESKINYKELKNLGYLEPFYIFESNDASKSITGKNFLSYNNYFLDSLFKARPQKFKIDKKVEITKDQKLEIQTELEKVFNEIEIKKTLENLSVSEKLIALEKSKLEFIMIFLIKPTIISAEEKYAPAVVLAPNNPFFYIDTSDVKALIFDLNKKEFVFYARKSGKLNDLGYNNKMIEDLNYFYKYLKKK